MRKIRLVNQYQYKTIGYDRLWCVYLLEFGNGFYIGGTNKLIRRIQAHHSSINTILSGNDDYPQACVYSKIIPFIKDNNINEYSFKVYAYCNTKHETFCAESFLLEKYFGSQLCLNHGNRSILSKC